MSDIAAEVHGLRMRYGTTDVLDGIDFRVRTGEVVALLGPNGAGKTTTIEILEGFRARSAGQVTVLGADPERAGEQWRARLGIVLQSWRDHAKWQVRELLHHLGAYYVPYSTAAIPRPWDTDELIDLVGLTAQADKRITNLSGGQRRRLDVAIGIVGRPELLFLDEPTTGFDPEARRQFWELIRQLAGDGTTILLTTHYLPEAEALADRVGVLAGGQLAALGGPVSLGGRLTEDAVVSWDTPAGRRSVASRSPATVVNSLAAELGGDVPGLTVTRPSLEDIYLDLIAASR